MSEESNKVESLLFSSGRKMREDEIVQLTNLKLSQVKKGLEELKEKYGDEDSSLMLDNEGDTWKLAVREKYLGIVQNIVSETELDKSIMETLAVIAWKYPILQADVIKIRNNKAYEHMKELEAAGFIAREVYGRTRSIKLTQKFFDYFDLPKGEQTRETFRQAVPEEVRDAIEKREGEIKDTEEKVEEAKAKKEEMEQKMREEKEKAEQLEKEIDIVDDFGAKTKLETYEEKPEDEEERNKEVKEIKEKLQPEIITEGKEDNKRQEDKEKKADEIVAKVETEEVAPEVEKRIEEMIHPEGYVPPKQEEPKEEKAEEEEPKEEPEETHEEREEKSEEEEGEFTEKNYTKEEQEHSDMENLAQGKPEDFEDTEEDQRAA